MATLRMRAVTATLGSNGQAGTRAPHPRQEAMLTATDEFRAPGLSYGRIRNPAG
jgi:hypothetical protein